MGREVGLCGRRRERRGKRKEERKKVLIKCATGVVGPHYASSKSALHGLIHWLSSAYCKKGITVNGVAPALIENTAMLPGGSEELKASKL